MAIRKVNRALEALNEYSKTRIVIRAYSQENRHKMIQLNERTRLESERLLAGEMSEKEWLSARISAAQELGLNDIVGFAEERILTTLGRLRELVGPESGDLVRNEANYIKAEDIVANYRKQLNELMEALTKEKRKLKKEKKPTY